MIARCSIFYSSGVSNASTVGWTKMSRCFCILSLANPTLAVDGRTYESFGHGNNRFSCKFDANSCEACETNLFNLIQADAINDFEGGMVLVSHDFRLINQVAEEIWICEKGTVTKWKGNILDYKDHLKKRIVKDIAKQTQEGKKV